jgi:hypothetical protein
MSAKRITNFEVLIIIVRTIDRVVVAESYKVRSKFGDVLGAKTVSSTPRCGNDVTGFFAAFESCFDLNTVRINQVDFSVKKSVGDEHRILLLEEVYTGR